MDSGLTEEELELLEPHPDIHALFVHYNSLYFEDKLGACSVEWSSARMTLCGGVCEFRPGGGCRIKLSEPLLKLRPSRDLKMVLLHEMIHAFMMLQGIRDDDPGGHGTIFKSIMARINASTLPDPWRPPSGYHITTTHSMFAEVDHYRQHHWRCERCGSVIKRAMNRPPQEADCRLHVKGSDCGDQACQYHLHLRHCGGQWIKIKEPEGFSDKQRKKGRKAAGSSGGSAAQGSSGGSGTGGAARADGAPVPAKRPKKAGGLGAGGRPITDFFPTTGPSSPPLSALGGGSAAGGPRGASTSAAAAAAAAEGDSGSAVLRAIQAVQEHREQQQKQQEQRPQRAEPSAEERRRLLAEATLRRLGRAGEPTAAQQEQQQQQQDQQRETQAQQQQGQQQEQQQQQPQGQQRRQGQPPPPLPPPLPQQQHTQVPEPAAVLAASPGFVDLAGSDDEGGADLTQALPQRWRQRQQQAGEAAAGAVPATGQHRVSGSLQGTHAGPAAAAAAVTGSALQAAAAGGAAADAAVACPICGKRWLPAAGLASAQLNAELNAHIDECLTLSALAE